MRCEEKVRCDIKIRQVSLKLLKEQNGAPDPAAYKRKLATHERPYKKTWQILYKTGVDLRKPVASRSQLAAAKKLPEF